jgi:hypothetical protein
MNAPPRASAGAGVNAAAVAKVAAAASVRTVFMEAILLLREFQPFNEREGAKVAGRTWRPFAATAGRGTEMRNIGRFGVHASEPPLRR